MPLTDRPALLRNRARAARAPELFLHEEAAIEVEERLALVNRTFTKPAIVSPWPSLWSEIVPGAKIVSDDETLLLEEGAHDLVIHGLCLHWANDPVGQLIQARRAMQPDGLLLVTLLGGQTLSELRAALAEAEIAQSGGLSPRVLPMGEIRDLGAVLQRAGFSLPVADSIKRTVSYRDMWALMRDLRAMGESNAMADRLRSPSPRSLFSKAEKGYKDAHEGADGRITATFEIICLTGWAPGPDQPKALRPGSAKTRLADALETSETPLNDPPKPARD